MRFPRIFQSTFQSIITLLRANPVGAGLTVGAVFSFTLLAIYTLVVQDVIQTYVWPWLDHTTSVLNFLLFVGVLGLVLLALAWFFQLGESTSLRALAAQVSPEATRTRLSDAEGKLRHTQRNLDVSQHVLTIIIDAFRYESRDPKFIEQVILSAMKLVIEDAQKMYAHKASRGSIWAPDPRNPEYLIVIQDVNLDQWTVVNGRFYVGTDPKLKDAQGTAGKVFRDRKARVRHINPTDLGSSDGKEYIRLDKERRVPLYESFAAYPIVHEKRCLGVLCLDSPQSDCFGKDSDLGVLAHSAKLLGELLRLREKAIELESASVNEESGA